MHDQVEGKQADESVPPAKVQRGKAPVRDPYPSLTAAMAAWTVDADPAARPTLTVFWAGATCVKAVLTDRRTGLQLWASSTRLQGVLGQLDELLSGTEVPWEVASKGRGASALVRLLEEHTGRKPTLRLQ